MAKNLWGNFEELKRVNTPALTLDEQADILTESTKNVLRGEVATITRYSVDLGKEAFHSTLSIIVPRVNNYTYALLVIIYPVELYPLLISNYVDGSDHECNNEEEFMYELNGILSSEKVKTVLSTLISLR